MFFELHVNRLEDIESVVDDLSVGLFEVFLARSQNIQDKLSEIYFFDVSDMSPETCGGDAVLHFVQDLCDEDVDVMQRGESVALLGYFEIFQDDLGLSAVGKVTGQQN